MRHLHKVRQMAMDKHRGFIDIHSHFLPFLDDGAENDQQCLAAARCYQSAGIDQVIATPHFLPGTKWAAAPEQISDSIRRTGNILREQGISITILPGMEIMLTDMLGGNFDLRPVLSLGGKGAYLVEFPLHSPYDASMAERLEHWQAAKDMHFVIAHPERCAIFNDNSSSNRLAALVNMGMMVQVNIDSLMGLAGKKAQQAASAFLQAGIVHFLASDAHPRDGRMPPDNTAMDRLTRLLGRKTTIQALRTNPMNLLAGKKVDPLPPDGNIHFSAQLHAMQGGYMQKLKNLFTHKQNLN
jgi:protein-tyrosine phosphatase